MQKNDMAEKKRLLVDGEELPGLVRVAEVSVEYGELEVPEFNKTRRITNGVAAIPTIEATYKVSRDTTTLAFLKRWHAEKETHDVTVVYTDGHGVEYDRDLWPRVELSAMGRPAYEAQTPVYAQVTVRFVPWDIKNVGPR